MRATFAIASREWASYLRTPGGWIVASFFLLLTGIAVSYSTIGPGQPATLRGFFSASHFVLLLVGPAIAMKLLADEFRTGSIETLMSSPVSDWQTIIGKYLGAVAFLVTLFLPTLSYVAILELVADPDYGPILAGYLGLLLMGMLYIGVGLFASTLTQSAVVALLGTLFFLMLVEFVATSGAEFVGAPLDRVLYALSTRLRIEDFAKGVIDIAHIVFFVVASFWFVMLSAVALESRRWR